MDIQHYDCGYLDLAALLIMKGIPLQSITCSETVQEGSRMDIRNRHFWFEDKKRCDEIYWLWKKGSIRVDPQVYMATRRMLKEMVDDEMENVSKGREAIAHPAATPGANAK